MTFDGQPNTYVHGMLSIHQSFLFSLLRGNIHYSFPGNLLFVHGQRRFKYFLIILMKMEILFLSFTGSENYSNRELHLPQVKNPTFKE